MDICCRDIDRITSMWEHFEIKNKTGKHNKVD